MKHLFDLPLQYDKGAVRESNGSFLCATTKQDGEAIAKAVNSYELLRETLVQIAEFTVSTEVYELAIKALEKT